MSRHTYMENIQKQHSKAARKEEQKLKYLQNAVREVAKTDQGLDVLDWILSICELYHDSFTEKTLSTIHNCGKKTVGLQLLALLQESDSNIYIKIQQRRIKRNG